LDGAASGEVDELGGRRRGGIEVVEFEESDAGGIGSISEDGGVGAWGESCNKSGLVIIGRGETSILDELLLVGAPVVVGSDDGARRIEEVEERIR
jgi:hypothetical protein